MRNKVSHSTTGMARVKKLTKQLSKIVGVINYHRDMNHLDNFLFFPILDLEIRSFNIACTVNRMMNIDNVDVGFIIFKNYSRTSRRLFMTVQETTNKGTDFSSRDILA